MARYGRGMMETTVNPAGRESIEDILHQGLVQGDAMAETVAPILRHLLVSTDSSLFSDEIVARVRGMLADLANQLLDKMQEVGEHEDRGPYEDRRVSALCDQLAEDTALLCHLHALAVEWQLTDRLQARLALDPVLPPLVHALVSSPDPETSALAMKFLASQARHCQSQRRMRLLLGELPGDLLHTVLIGMRTVTAEDPEAESLAEQAERAIRSSYDEGISRLGLMSRMITGMGGGAVAALSVGHAGAAIFLTALALGSGQDRDAAVLSTNEAQMSRLVLGLCAAGLKSSGVAEQFQAIHPDLRLPEGLASLSADRAAAILAVGATYPGE